MTTPEWETALVSPALTLDGQTTQIVAGRIRLNGHLSVVLRAGEGGPIVVLRPFAATELIANIRALTGDEP